MSLDVSPDGSTIVFDLLGDLYSIPITGGTARRLTSGMAFNAQPRFSPDGRQLVFVSDRNGVPNLWIMDWATGSVRQLSKLPGLAYDSRVSSPAWSPNGRTIVVSQRFGRSRPRSNNSFPANRWLLAAYDVASGGMRWVSDTTFEQARQVLGATVSPDGMTVYAAVEPYKPSSSHLNLWRIERIDLTTGIITQELAPSLGRGGLRPAASPDGRFLAYVSSSGSRLGLRVRDLRTMQERWLVQERLESIADPGLAQDSRDLVPGYAFTPDAKALVVAFGGKIHRIHLATGRARIIPFVVDVERGVGPLTVHQYSFRDAARTRSVMHPALAPDGRAVAFSALSRLWILKLTQEGRSAGFPRRLTADSVGEFYPSWSPDGQWIAYSAWRDGEGGSVRRVRVTMGMHGEPASSERLTADTALYFQTAVSPDGKRVVVVRAGLPPERVLTHGTPSPPVSLSLAWVPATGGPPRPIMALDTMQQIRYPVEQVYFSDDPNRIYLGLISWRWDGALAPGAFIIADSEEAFPGLVDGTGMVSPDRRRALVTHKWTLSEITLPAEPDAATDTVDVEMAQGRPFGAVAGSASRWGTALAPWVSWARDGSRVLFSQGGSLFVGDVRPSGWTEFIRVDVQRTMPVDIPRGILVLRGARLITMRRSNGSDPEVFERGDLVVRDNRILAVGATGTVAIPSGARVLDLSGKTILPGYVDIHDHLPIPYGVHPEQAWQCLVRLAYGVTALRDPYAIQFMYNDLFAFQDLEQAGQLLGPRVFSTGIAHLRSDRPIRTLHDARDIVRPNTEYFGAETFKEYDGRATRQERQLILMAATEAAVNATIEGGSVAARGLTAIIDGFPGLEHALPIRIYDDVATFIAHSGTTHTQTYATLIDPTYLLHGHGGAWNLPRMRRYVPPSARAWAYPVDVLTAAHGRPELDKIRPELTSAAEIARRGGRVGIGSHGNIGGIGFHYEMWLHALGGMPNHEILKSATIVGATAIGYGRELGSLEVGKLADLQVLDRSPLEDIHHTTTIRYVMKNGRLFEASNLTEIWPRNVALANTYLWEDASTDVTATGARTEPRADPSLQY